MPGARPDILRIGRLADIHVKVGIGSAQAPEIARPPFRRDFRTFGVAVQAVAEVGRQKKVRGQRDLVSRKVRQ